MTFDIDANGILHVNAKDKKTGKEQGMQVVAPNKMAREEIDAMVKQAEQYASQDKEELEQAQTRNDAETMMYTSEKMMKDYSDKIPKDVSAKVTKARDTLKVALDKDDTSEIKQSLESLKNALQEIGSSVYGQGPQQGGPGAGPGPEGGPGPGAGSGDSGDSVDADFKVEK